MEYEAEPTDSELHTLGKILGRVPGGAIQNAEALDGFLAAVVCCPDHIMPSEYIPFVLRSYEEDGDFEFESDAELEQFHELVDRLWNYVSRKLHSGDIYYPLLQEDGNGRYLANDWAKGFLLGTELRSEIWFEATNVQFEGGAIIPILALAFEHDEDPQFRLFDGPIPDEKRKMLLVGLAAGVALIFRYFQKKRKLYRPSLSIDRSGRKTGRNAPCPCGSGKKYKQCCGHRSMLH